MNIIEALNKLAAGEFSAVRPVKWNTDDKSYGVIVKAMPGNGQFSRVWSYFKNMREAIPFMLDDLEIINGEWEAVDPDKYFQY